MATPNYKGPNQPLPNGSGWLSSWIGGTPAYKNPDKPSAAATTNANGAQAAPASGDVAVMATMGPGDGCGGPIAIVIPRQVIEQQ